MMKRLSKKLFSLTLFSLTLLVSAVNLFANNCSTCGTSSCCETSDNVLPYLSFRSAGRDSVRKLVGITSYAVWQYDKDSCYGTFQLIPAYERSIRPKQIAECLFGCDLQRDASGDCPTNCDDGRVVKVSGSQVVGRAANTNDWMAENFYLPRNFQSTLQFKPLIQNIILDFHLYVGLDQWAKGLYFRLYGPVVNARYNLNFCESDVTVGNVGYQEGFVNDADGENEEGDNAVPVSDLLQSATSYFRGNTPDIAGITTQGLQNAKICSDQQTNTCFGDLRFELGWNPVLEKDYLFGFGIEFAAPTGRRPDGCFLFEPQCGNGKHWELGGNIHALWTIWRSEDEDQHWDFVIDADITHLFNAKQRRTFDLNGKPLSRYMLAQKLGDTRQGPGGDNGDQLTGASNAGVEYQSELAPVANFSTRNIKVSAAVQADLVAMLDFTIGGFSWDVGYNFWGRSCEKIKFRNDCDDCGDCGSCSSCKNSCNTASFPDNTWALKGDAHVVGWRNEEDEVTNVRLAATESGATIHAGTNTAAVTPGIPANLNPGIDSPELATTNNAANDEDDITVIATNVFNPDLIVPPTRSSVPPVYISQSDLNCNARSKGISHKVFTHFNYTWVDQDNWAPYLGVGVSAEFGKTDSNSCCTTTSSSSTSSNNDCCTNCALSKWALWLKLGVSY